jgi:hypothetical protein
VKRALPLVLLTTLALAVPAATARADATEWTRVDVPASVRPLALLNAVGAGSATRAWAVGQEYEGTSSAGEVPGVPLVLRMTGTRWVKVALPAIDWKGALTSVAAIGPGQFWAVGTDAGGGLHLLHGNGSGVTEEPLPAAAAGATSLRVQAALGRQPWLLGTNASGATILLRRTATGWRSFDVPPAPFVPSALEPAPDGTVWLAGYVERQLDPTFPITVPIVTVYRRTGSTWTALPDGPLLYPSDVLTGTDGGLWVSGRQPTLQPGPVPLQGGVAHWTGSAWVSETLPPQSYGDLVLSGDDAGQPEYGLGTYGVASAGYLKRAADGTWIRVANAPAVPPESAPLEPLRGIAHLPGTTSTVAVGHVRYVYDGQYAPRIEREDAP